MAKDIDEQKAKALLDAFKQLDPSEQEEEDELDYTPEEDLTPEEVLAVFRIMAGTMEETMETGPDWEPWSKWTSKQAQKLADYVNCLNWHMGVIKTTLQLIGIEVDE